MIKKGTQVQILCGKDKGKKGEVIEILINKNKAKVKGINIIKKHEKTTKEKKGGIISKENFIHISNLKILDTKDNKNNITCTGGFIIMVKKGEQVEILCGKDKGKKGEVLEILKTKHKAKVKGINFIKKHEKTTKEKKGGIISKENFIHISNLKILDENKKKTKIIEKK